MQTTNLDTKLRNSHLRLRERLARRKLREQATCQEEIERVSGWYTTRAAQAHFQPLQGMSLKSLSSYLNRMRKLMGHERRRMPSSGQGLGILTYRLEVVEAVVREVLTRALPSNVESTW
jgi:hypothetical protein